MTGASTTPPSSSTSQLVVAEDLHRAFGHGEGRVVAIDGASLTVRRGEPLVIRGRSGCGKSTLLHCLSGILEADGGTVTYHNPDGTSFALNGLDEDRRTDLRAQRMGFVFQTLNLLPALTVRENVELSLVLRTLTASEVHPRVDAALEAVGMAARGTAWPAELSGGQQQRVALARALVGEPDVIWADEPTGALDSAAENDMLTLLRGVVQDIRTVVVVSHAEAVAAIADRVLAMRDGRMI